MSFRRPHFVAARAALFLLMISRCLWSYVSFAQAELPKEAPAVTDSQKLRTQAENGDVSAELQLASAYCKGTDVPLDYSKSAFWFLKAANQDSPIAQYELGKLYHQGLGVPQDDAQAVVWYHKAADQGLAKAEVALGSHLISGKGVSSDAIQAADWFQRAANQGDAEGERELAGLYDGGIGVPTDYSQAAFWYRKAAEQGDAYSEYILGSMYYAGRGVPKDLALAEEWDRKAADQGNPLAQYVLSGIVQRKEDEIRQHDEMETAGFFAIILGILAIAFYQNKERLFAVMNKINPRTKKTRQLAILMAIAVWYTGCFIYFVQGDRPDWAAKDAFVYSMPAIAFGAIALWWLAQPKGDQ